MAKHNTPASAMGMAWSPHRVTNKQTDDLWVKKTNSNRVSSCVIERGSQPDPFISSWHNGSDTCTHNHCTERLPLIVDGIVKYNHPDHAANTVRTLCNSSPYIHIETWRKTQVNKRLMSAQTDRPVSVDRLLLGWRK